MIDIYTDGSYQPKISPDVIGWGWIIPERQVSSYSCWRNGISDDINLVRSHNVGGELMAVIQALDWCKENDISKVCIHYDFEGVAKWITGEWKPFVAASRWYKETVEKDYMNNMEILFRHVPSHSHDMWNDKADELAKDAIYYFDKWNNDPPGTKWGEI